MDYIPARLNISVLVAILSLSACATDGDDIDLLGPTNASDAATGDLPVNDMVTMPVDMLIDAGLNDGDITLPSSEAVVYSLGVNLVELGDYLLPLQLEVVPVRDEDVLVGYERLSLRAVKDGNASEIFAEVTDVEVMNGNTFVANFAESILPMAYSPTGSDVVFELKFEGTVKMDGRPCGLVTGQIVTLETELIMSTFGTVVWDDGTSPPPGACNDDEESTACPR